MRRRHAADVVETPASSGRRTPRASRGPSGRRSPGRSRFDGAGGVLERVAPARGQWHPRPSSRSWRRARWRRAGGSRRPASRSPRPTSSSSVSVTADRHRRDGLRPMSPGRACRRRRPSSPRPEGTTTTARRRAACPRQAARCRRGRRGAGGSGARDPLDRQPAQVALVGVPVGAETSTVSRISSSGAPSYHGVRLRAVDDVVARQRADRDDVRPPADRGWRPARRRPQLCDLVEARLVEKFDEVHLVDRHQHVRARAAAPRSGRGDGSARRRRRDASIRTITSVGGRGAGEHVARVALVPEGCRRG